MDKKGHGNRYSINEHLEVRRRVAAGERYKSITRATGVSPKTICRLEAKYGGMMPRLRRRSPRNLSLQEREEISLGLKAGLSLRAIARAVRRSASTISREVRRAQGRGEYRAWRADKLAYDRAQRPKITKLAKREGLRREVEVRLMKLWSPQQVAATLRQDFPGRDDMNISHETIYRSLFVQARGSLRRELTAFLRTGRTRRKPEKRHSLASGRRRGLIMISARPAEVEDRAVPGHWEGDLILGSSGKGAVATLVERHSRFVMLLPVPNERTAEVVCAALTKKITTLPKHLRKSLTWDQGMEMALHAKFTVATQVDVYFCDPHSPWQRGSNENTNGLLRQYLPRELDFSTITARQLDAIARSLNERPRKTLAWKTPAEVFASAVAATV